MLHRVRNNLPLRALNMSVHGREHHRELALSQDVDLPIPVSLD
jgi:hypothetical protein